MFIDCQLIPNHTMSSASLSRIMYGREASSQELLLFLVMDWARLVCPMH